MNLKAKHLDKIYFLPAYAHYGFFMHGIGNVPVDDLKTQRGLLRALTDKTKNSFSIAIMSDLTPFWGLAGVFQYGYIFYAPSNTPKGMVPLKIICAFPFHAISTNRLKDHGCTSSDPAKANTAGKFCHELGINNIFDWENRCKYGAFHDQCPFDMREKRYARERFRTVVQAFNLVQDLDTYSYKKNEVLAKAYDDPKTIPIQAIFIKYESNSDIVDIVKRIQTDLNALTGRNIPIVEIHFPSTANPTINIKNFPWPPKPEVDVQQKKEFYYSVNKWINKIKDKLK